MARMSGIAGSMAVIAALLAMPLWAAESVSGRFLVAEPDLGGSPFGQTVILMFEHGDAGAAGVVVNRPVEELALSDIVDEPPDAIADRRVGLYSGGPVEENSLIALHDAGFEAEGTESVAEGIAMSPLGEVLEAMADERGPEELRLYAGYAGWAPEQLESELARDSWHVIPADAGLVFSRAPGAVWDEATRRRQTDL